jgi:hypothetical protein
MEAQRWSISTCTRACLVYIHPDDAKKLITYSLSQSSSAVCFVSVGAGGRRPSGR